MNFRRLQQQAASCVDELLSVSIDMDEYVIAAYGRAPREVVDMQCRIQLEQLKRLRKKLAGIREELAHVTGPGEIIPSDTAVPGNTAAPRAEVRIEMGKPEGREAGKPQGMCDEAARHVRRIDTFGLPASAEKLSGEQRRSIAVTGQIIDQNLLIIAQKEELLKGFLAHSAMVGIQQKHAKELNDTAEIIRLKKILRGEQVLCRTESEK